MDLFNYGGVLEVCIHILKVSEFDLIQTTIYDYLVVYKEYYEENVRDLAVALLYSTIMTPIRYNNHPKYIALACIVLSCCYYSKTFKHTALLNKEIVRLSEDIIKNISNNKKSRSLVKSKLKYLNVDDLIERLSGTLCVL